MISVVLLHRSWYRDDGRTVSYCIDNLIRPKRIGVMRTDSHGARTVKAMRHGQKSSLEKPTRVGVVSWRPIKQCSGYENAASEVGTDWSGVGFRCEFLCSVSSE